LGQGVQGCLDARREQKGARGVTLGYSPGRPDDLLANQQGAGWKACRTHGIMEGHKRSRLPRMAGSEMELKAFFKSNCKGTHPVLPCRAST